MLIQFTRLASAIVMLAATAFAGHAAIVSYDESTDGELGFLTNTFALDTPGLNSVAGHSEYTGVFDNDSFFITLSPGLKIVQFTFSFSNATQTDILFIPSYALQELDGGTFLKDAVYSIATGVTTPLVTLPPPYLFEEYRVWLGGQTISGSAGDNPFASFDWKAEITVEAVPIPGALPLFATSLGAFGYIAWRGRRMRKLVP